MTSQPDKLFRDHLEHYQKPAPGSAWDRIEAGLDRRSSQWLWLKIAAGILFLVVASFLFWPGKETTRPEMQANADKPVLDTHVLSPIVAESSPANQNQIVTEVTKSKNKTKAATLISTQAEQELQKDIVAIPIEINPENNLMDPIQSAENPHQAEAAQTEYIPPTLQENNKPSAKSGSTIVYTSSEMNSRFLKKDLRGEATPEKKNTSDMQKILSLAYELKHDANIYGDLREKKNELLTFNLFTDKKDPNK